MSQGITLHTSPQYGAEKKYVAGVLFGEFLGMKADVVLDGSPGTTTLLLPDGGRIIITDSLFETAPEDWLKAPSLPRLPLARWNPENLGEKELPVLYGTPLEDGRWFSEEGKTIRLGLDVFGSIFFMLTRYEEAVKTERDKHGRFPAAASLAFQENFLDRAIVNEYAELLRNCLRKLSPGLPENKKTYSVKLTHDVDRPLAYAFKPLAWAAKSFTKDLLTGKTSATLKEAALWRSVRKGNTDADPFNRFNWMMDLTERANLKSAFYFIPESYEGGNHNCDYRLEHPFIRNLMKRIHERGHEIGYHATYSAHQNPGKTKAEFNRLTAACESLDIRQETWGGRHHYLRWDPSRTWSDWEEAGLDYDSTLSYADRLGFRCGTCYEFPVFDLLNRKELKLRERPLIVMECTVTDDCYMGYGLGEKAREAIVAYADTCRKFNGDFVMVWHNSSLATPAERDLYESVLGGIL